MPSQEVPRSWWVAAALLTRVAGRAAFHDLGQHPVVRVLAAGLASIAAAAALRQESPPAVGDAVVAFVGVLAAWWLVLFVVSLARKPHAHALELQAQVSKLSREKMALERRIAAGVNLPPIWRTKLYRIMEIASETEHRLRRDQPVDDVLRELQIIGSGLGSLDDEDAPVRVISAIESFVAWAEFIAEGNPIIDTLYCEVLVLTCRAVLEKYPLLSD